MKEQRNGIEYFDVDSKEAAAEMALAETDSSPKFICVGDLLVESA